MAPRKKNPTKRKSPTKRSTPTKRKSPTKRESKTLRGAPVPIDDMKQYQLRAMAASYGVKSGAVSNATLRRRIKTEMAKTPPSEDFENLETGGSQSTAKFAEKEYNVTITDTDIEPLKRAKVERAMEGVYVIEQESQLGEQEIVVVNISDNEETAKRKLSGAAPSPIPTPPKSNKPRIIKKIAGSPTIWNPNVVVPPPPSDYFDATDLTKRGELRQSGKAKKARKRIAFFDEQVKEYNKRKWVYFYQATLASGTNKGRRQNDLVDIADFDNMQEKKFMVEKEQVLKDAKIKYNDNDLVKTGGNEIQSSFDDELNWVGLFDQRVTNEGKWIPHFAKADKIFVDDDGAGNYMAYLNNLYAYNDPLKPNMYFVDAEGKVSTKGRSPNELVAHQFWAKQFANSAAYRRNRIILAVVKDVLRPDDWVRGDQYAPLTYRTSLGGTKEFVISDQALALAAKAYDPDATLIFNTSETKVEFEVDKEVDISDSLTTESTVELEFIEKKGEKQPLTSDLLVGIMVREKGLDPIAAQVLLENLYQSGWIDYPRKNEVRAIEDPVRVIKDISNFKGTAQEREMLTLVDKAEKAHEEGKNFILNGKWVVWVNKEIVIQKPAKKTVLIPNKFSSDQFDVSVNRDGLTDDSITEWMQTNKIGTPATRMVILANLKEAGILTKINDRYVLDSRGIVLSSTHDYFEDTTFSAVDMNRRIMKAETIPEIEVILAEIQPIPRESTVEAITNRANPRIEAQKDIAVLDTF